MVDRTVGPPKAKSNCEENVLVPKESWEFRLVEESQAVGVEQDSVEFCVMGDPVPLEGERRKRAA
jgi:hypothetical protein